MGLISALALGFVLPQGLPASAEQEGERGGERPVFGPEHGDTDGIALHVMSFNLRYAAPTGAHAWRKRRPLMAELLGTELPTVLGTQEGLRHQLLDIAADLPERYDWIGAGREGGTRGEHCAIFFDTGRLTPLESGDFWLSDTPDVPGSRSWGNTTVRMATWVRFEDKRTGVGLAVLNTHLDNMSEPSRVRGAELIRDRVDAFPPDLPVIVTGDFNAPAGDSAAYSILTEGAGLVDTWTAASEHRSPRYATFHDFHGLVLDGPRIDWMFTRGDLTVSAAGINGYSRAGRFPSDHLPIQALVRIGAESTRT